MPTLPELAIVIKLVILPFRNSNLSPRVEASPPARIVNLPWFDDEAPPAGWKSIEADDVAPVERMMKLVVVEESSNLASGLVVPIPIFPAALNMTSLVA